MAESWKIIANPSAGGGRWFAKKVKIEHYFRKEEIDISWHFPEGIPAVHALIADLLAQGNRHFISAGGDGTLHHIINAILSQDEVPPSEIKISVLPLGTGNDWIKTHKISKNLKRAIQTISKGKEVLQDIGLVEYQNDGQKAQRYFCNVAGSGFEAEVVKGSLSLKKGGLKGTFLYLGLVLKTLMSYKSQIHAVNAQLKAPMLLTTLGICRFNGGGMQLVPEADPFDGVFDLTCIADLSRGEVIRNLPKLYNGQIYRHPKVSHERLDSYHLDGPSPIPIEADGEFLGYSPAEFSLLPARVVFIVP